MKRNLLGAASALFLMTGGAFAASVDQPGHQSPQPGTSSESMSAVKDGTAGLVGQVSAEMTHSTKDFVTAAATSDMYEVTAGKIAAQRAQSPEVREFAEKMIKAHTLTTKTLKGIIAEKQANPDDGLISRIAHAEIEGRAMSEKEIFGFVIFLFIGGKF